MPMSPRLLRPIASRATFDPTTVGTLSLWLDAADSSTVTLNGGNVSEWRSKVGGRVFSQATAASQPIYAAGYRAGRNALQFDGSRRIASTQAASAWRFLHAERNITFAVFEVTSGGNALRIVASTFPVYATNNTVGVNFTADQRTATQNRVGSDGPAGGVPGAYAWSNSLSGVSGGVMRAYKFVADPSVVGTSSAVALQRMVVSANDNTSDNATGLASSVNAATGTDPDGTLVIGAQNASGSLTFPFSGYVCEWLVYGGNSLLSASQQDAVTAYLRAKWAL